MVIVHGKFRHFVRSYSDYPKSKVKIVYNMHYLHVHIDVYVDEYQHGNTGCLPKMLHFFKKMLHFQNMTHLSIIVLSVREILQNQIYHWIGNFVVYMPA